MPVGPFRTETLIGSVLTGTAVVSAACAGVPDSVVGIEHKDDIIADLEQALQFV